VDANVSDQPLVMETFGQENQGAWFQVRNMRAEKSKDMGLGHPPAVQ
jgi:hypothetical protein